MSKININNYESYLVDYADGTLSASDKLAMMLFLKQHSEIANQLTQFSNAPVLYPSSDSLTKSFKSNLKKDNNSISAKELDELLIKELEGDLSLAESKILTQQFEKNKVFERERELVYCTKITADLNVVFPDKESLKKKSKVIPLFYYTSVAASLLIAFGAYYLFNSRQPIPGNVFEKKQLSLVTLKNSALKDVEQSGKKKNVFQHTKTTNNSRSFITNNVVATTSKIERLQGLPLHELPLNQLPADLAINKKENNISSASNTVAKIDYLTIAEFINRKLKVIARKNSNTVPNSIKEQKLNGFDIASVAVNLVSKVSKKKIELQKSYNSDGSTREIALVSENFEFSKKK